MTEFTKSVAQCKMEDDASGLLVSPEKLNYPLPFVCLTPPKRTSLYAPDVNEVNFPKELQYIDYASPLPSQSTNLKSHSLSASPTKLPEEITRSLLSPGMIRQVITSRNIVTVSMPQQRSIMTINESFRRESKTLFTNNNFTLGVDRATGKPFFSSLKISIGSFNSINAEVSSIPQIARDPVVTLGTGSKTVPKAKCCNCKKSKCLKLYCECFASGTFCQGCSCINCYNTKVHEAEILDAKESIGERNPQGLKRHFPESSEVVGVSCNCSKSGCLKKYCQCFKSNKKCGTGCNCTGCKNTTALRTILYEKCERITKRQKVEVA